MHDALSRFRVAGWLALTGSAFVAVFVPLVPGREALRGVPLDTVILTVPIAILLAIPLLRRAGREAIPRVGIELPALVFLGWALLSTLFTGMEPGVIATWARYAGYVVLVYVTAAVAADATRRRVLLWVIALAGSVTVGHGFWQYIRPAENIGMLGLDAEIATRVYATFGNPNFYAEYLVLLFAVTLALFFSEKRLPRYTAAFLLAAQAIGLLLTYTRGSWIALAAGIVIGLMMIDGRLVWPFAMGAAALLPLVPGAFNRMLSILSLEGTASFRLRLWEVAGVAMLERPLFGIGMGRFYDAFTDAVLNNAHLNIGYLLYGAHNSYFQLGAEIGIPGMLAFTWLTLEVCRAGVFYNLRMASDLTSRLVNAALTAGLVAFAINALSSNAFQHPRGAVFFFVLAGIQAGIGMQYWDMRPHVGGARVASQSLWANSTIGRTFGGMGRFVREAWIASGTRRLVMREPEGGGRLFATSLMARALYAERREPQDSVAA